MAQERDSAVARTQQPSGELRDVEGLVGRTVGGKYKVHSVIARGGMGRIYRAEQVPLGRPVALKVLHTDFVDPGAVDAGFQKRFLLEAASCARLNHPNIVVIYDYGRLEETGREVFFMAMELIEGVTLAQALKESGSLPVPRALHIAREILRALREAHRQGMVHRDLKPTNVMLSLTADGEHVKVLDFGLVKMMRDDSEELTKEGHFLGSPKYMAPEQIKRSKVDGRADLYALGVLLYQMLSGRLPFEGEQAVQTLMAHLTEAPPPFPPGLDLPSSVQRLVLRLLEKEPDARYPNADAVIHGIDEIAASMGWVMDRRGTLSGETTRSAVGTSDPGLGRVSRPSTTPPPGAEQAPTQSISRASISIALPSMPAPGSPSRGPMLALAAMLILGPLFGVAALIGMFASRPAPQTAASTTPADTSPELPPVGTVSAPPDEESPAAPASFTLFAASTPAGASLIRGGETIGTTPTFVELDSASLAASPTTFRIELAGHAPYVWTQGPSTQDVHLEVALEPLSQPAVESPIAPRPSRRRSGTQSAATTQAAPEQPPPPRGADVAIKTRR